MKSFTVFYNRGVLEELSTLGEKEAVVSKQTIMKQRLEKNLSQIEVAKVLEGLIVHNRQELIGSLCVSGPQEKIDQLKAFLEEKNLGTVVPNEASFRGAEEKSS